MALSATEEQALNAKIAHLRAKLDEDRDDKLLRHQLAVALSDMGTQLKVTGHLECAKERYDESMSFDERYPDVHYNLAVCSLCTGRCALSLLVSPSYHYWFAEGKGGGL